MGREPTLIIQAVVAALTAIQVSAISMTATAHTIVAVGIIGLGAVVNRQVVTPVKKRGARPSAG